MPAFLFVLSFRLIRITLEVGMPANVIAVRQNVIAAVSQETFAHRAQREVRVLLSPLENGLAKLDLLFRRAGIGVLDYRRVAWLPCLGQFPLVVPHFSVDQKIFARPTGPLL